MRSRYTLPSRWSHSCWMTRAKKPSASTVKGWPSRARTSGETARAGERITGWPMRATFRIMSAVELVAIAGRDLDDSYGGIAQQLEADDLAGRLAPQRGVELAHGGDGGAVEREDEVSL